MPYIAYSPFERDALALLAEIGKCYRKTVAQVALDWYTRWSTWPQSPQSR